MIDEGRIGDWSSARLELRRLKMRLQMKAWQTKNRQRKAERRW